jgi:hypothetical protein
VCWCHEYSKDGNCIVTAKNTPDGNELKELEGDGTDEKADKKNTLCNIRRVGVSL